MTFYVCAVAVFVVLAAALIAFFVWMDRTIP